MRELTITPAVLAYETKIGEYIQRRDSASLTEAEEEVYLSDLDRLWYDMTEDEAWTLNRRQALRGTPEHRAEVRANYAKHRETPDWLDEP